ncbi:hypothetical protein NUSPORA_01334 [Nucleospora cyclopteri]
MYFLSSPSLMDLLISDLFLLYSNEKSTDTLLFYSKSIERFANLLRRKIEITKELENGTLKNLHEIENHRIQFYIKSYLLCRLKKIKTNLFVDRNLLSEKEKIYAEKYYKELSDREILMDESEENVEFVGFIAIKKIDRMVLDEKTVELSVNDAYVAAIKDVYEWLFDGQIKLL